MSGWLALAMPSMVSMVAPSHSMASIMQESTGRPSMITLQAPQAPSAQNSLVPVRPNLSMHHVLESPLWLHR